jgi:hypothetical protein
LALRTTRGELGKLGICLLGDGLQQVLLATVVNGGILLESFFPTVDCRLWEETLLNQLVVLLTSANLADLLLEHHLVVRVDLN